MNRWTKRCMAFVLTLTIMCTSMSAVKPTVETTYAATVQKYYEVSKGCMQEDGCGESTVRI